MRERSTNNVEANLQNPRILGTLRRNTLTDRSGQETGQPKGRRAGVGQGISYEAMSQHSKIRAERGAQPLLLLSAEALADRLGFSARNYPLAC